MIVDVWRHPKHPYTKRTFGKIKLLTIQWKGGNYVPLEYSFMDGVEK
jgi:hypothetical protein